MSRSCARRLGALVVLTAAVAAGGAQSAAARTLVVTKRHVSFPHHTTIQGAVNAARAGDWILIDRGVYRERVLIRKPDLHLRGVDRSKVIIDGRHRVGNGIEARSSNVWIDNLTVRNFDRASREDDKHGNEIWWNGGDGSGKIGMHGWWGSYLTAYDTGLLGGYGEFVSNAVTGSMDHVFASGFSDSGVYVGACRDCRAVVDHATVVNSAQGYSGTNSGGHLVIENSTFKDNSFGIAPSSLTHDDPPPPQDGACDSGSNRSPGPPSPRPTSSAARCSATTWSSTTTT